jgi:tetratricopeptide (TPR) repeat protein
MQKFLLNSDLKSKFSHLKAKKNQSFDAALEISEFGRDLMSTGKFKESKKLYENLIQIIPESFVFWNNLGVALENMDEIERAVDCFKKALDINQSYSYALENLQRLKGQDSNKSLPTSSR